MFIAWNPEDQQALMAACLEVRISGNQTMQIRRWHCFDDLASMQQEVVRRIARCAAEALAARDSFHCVLAGGRTPEAIYRELRSLDTDWDRWIIYFGDERCLPVGDQERNDTLARKALLDPVAIPEAHVHAIPAELGPAAGATRYAESLAAVPEFDLVLLGLGEDGHTASLFPGDDAALRATEAAVGIDDAPKPPPRRVSMSAARLARSRAVVFMVAGADKREALHQWQQGAQIPAASILAPCGVDIYTDQRIG
jgi:6-phosphogluconolactonase